jgi:hypothetical protein
MKEYLTCAIAACAFNCATTQPVKEDYQVKPVVITAARDCSKFPQGSLEQLACLDLFNEEDTLTYAPTPTSPAAPAYTVTPAPATSPYTVTPKAVETTCDLKLPPEELLECLKKGDDED